MKKFNYKYSILQNDVITNSDGTNIKVNGIGMPGYLNEKSMEVFIPPDDLLEDAIVPEIIYTETNAVSVDKTVKAWTYYCDSLSGCVPGTTHYKDGDGSKDNPWRSLIYALIQIHRKLVCWRNTTCCYDPYRKGKYFQIKVKGTISYEVDVRKDQEFWYFFEGAEFVENKWVQQVIISPWENPTWTVSGMESIDGVIFNHLKLEGHINNATIYWGDYCVYNHLDIAKGYFYDCKASKFIDVTTSFIQNNVLTFPKCTGCDLIGFTGINSGLYMGQEMNIYNATVTIVDNSEEYYKTINGFTGFLSCGFYNCSANVSGTLNCEIWESSQGNKYFGYVDACGFYGNTNCTFYNCTTTNQCSKCADETHECRTPDF